MKILIMVVTALFALPSIALTSGPDGRGCACEFTGLGSLQKLTNCFGPVKKNGVAEVLGFDGQDVNTFLPGVEPKHVEAPADTLAAKRDLLEIFLVFDLVSVVNERFHAANNRRHPPIVRGVKAFIHY